jgi:hypothetical protein
VFSSAENAEQKRTWLKLISDYRDAMKILQKQSNYTVDDTMQFQLKIDDIFSAYVESLVQEKKVWWTTFICFGAIIFHISWNSMATFTSILNRVGRA